MNTIAIAIAFAANACFAPQGVQPAVQGEVKKARQTITISLKQDPPVRGAHIRLGDVVEISTSFREFTQKLAQLPMGRSPQFGYTRCVTQNDVRMCLLKHVKLTDAVRLDFLGPKQTFVSTQTRMVTADQLVRIATGLLDREILKDPNSDISYKLRGRVTDWRIPYGRESMRLEPRLHKGKLGTSHVVIDVHVMLDGEEHKIVPIYFALKRFYRVLAVAHTVRPGVEITEASLTWKRIEAQFGVSQFLTSLDQVRGMTTKRLLRRGETLTMTALSRQPMIRAGHTAQLVVASGRIRLKSRVVALEDGHYGEFIRVQRLRRNGQGRGRRRVSAADHIFARVISPSRVVLDTSPRTTTAPRPIADVRK